MTKQDNKEDLMKLNLIQLINLRNQYEEWEIKNGKKSTFLEIIEYGAFEPIHTKLFYWLLEPKFHDYGEKYLHKFFDSREVDYKKDSKIEIETELHSGKYVDKDEIKRRSDIWIKILDSEDKVVRNIIIENKINADLTPAQTLGEMKQYLDNENDIYIAMFLNDDIELLKRNKRIKEYRREKKIHMKEFKYVDWLKLNKEFNAFNKSEQSKIEHINENIGRLIKMDKIKKFDENYLTYLNSCKAIGNIQWKYREQISAFLKDISTGLSKIDNYEKFDTKKNLDKEILYFRYNNWGFEIWLIAKNLAENFLWIGITPLSKNSNVKVQKLIESNKSDYRENDGEKGEWGERAHWFQISVNPLDFDEMKSEIINQVTKYVKIIK